MAVKVRQRRLRNGDMYYQADIRITFPDGGVHRERVKASGSTRAAALRWARQREAHLLRHGVQGKDGCTDDHEIEHIPTLAEFVPTFRESYIIANRLKPSSRARWEDSLRLFLIPLLGNKQLDRIGAREFQRLKLPRLAPNTINGLLGNLGTILRAARDWGYPVTLPGVRHVKVPAKLPEFYDCEEYKALRHASRELGPVPHTLVLLGGEAGLRTGEITALERRDIDGRRGLITVTRNEYCGHVGDPKDGATRPVPITKRLRAALAQLPDRGARVLYRDGGDTFTASAARHWIGRVQRRAGLPFRGPQILRHTFCSHLAMRGAAPRAIQALAGHARSSTTDVYMHLSPRSLHQVMDLFEGEDERD